MLKKKHFVLECALMYKTMIPKWDFSRWKKWLEINMLLLPNYLIISKFETNTKEMLRKWTYGIFFDIFLVHLTLHSPSGVKLQKRIFLSKVKWPFIRSRINLPTLFLTTYLNFWKAKLAPIEELATFWKNIFNDYIVSFENALIWSSSEKFMNL